MPPKVKITREDVLRVATEIVRERGDAALNARSVADALGCSTQPVFSNFPSMEAVRLAVIEVAHTLYTNASEREVAEGKYPSYKAKGMAYIRFAREERELFKLLFMRDRARTGAGVEEDDWEKLVGFVGGYVGMEASSAALFHMEMWAFVHGIASMIATGYVELEEDLISRMLTDAFLGLKKRFAEVENGCHQN